ncbi:hypothetical protein [Rhizobium ruizarguesonis]|uniref:hypothetical protein n=1 Tax=Rhizobium ruizarguesonis TaxID=2081791 RepID=UPI0013EE594C|nr:hypothetical protein [Rhizobium ruizarguesonis]
MWRDDRRSAELLGDQSPQFAAGEKAGKRLPAPSNAADSLVIVTWFRSRNRGGCIYVVQKEILCRSAGIIDCCGIARHAATMARTDTQAFQS